MAERPWVKQEIRNRKVTLWRLVLALVVVGAVLLASTWRPSIAARAGNAAQSFDPAQVLRGQRLSALGLCANCHTANPAAPFAGGFAVNTPFGVVYSTNITPDNATGIGSWTREAFVRAMKQGVARDGHHLYPAFPYDHYTRLDQHDIEAIYAFMSTRDPVHAPARANQLTFPFGFRPLLAGWKLLFLDSSPVPADPAKGAEWNRGAYIAQALGHCAACHSPRNAFGAVDTHHYLGGGEAESWYVPALNAASPSPIEWDVDSLTQYLRTGIAPKHAIAGGPMQAVTSSLAEAEPAEVRSLATYIVSLMGKPKPAIAAAANAAASRPASDPVALSPAAAGDSVEARQLQLGASVYFDTCARCHAGGRTVGSGGALQLPAAIALYDPDPRSLIHIIRDGVPPREGEPGRWMPGFADILTDQQVTALAAYLRRHGANQPAWPNLAAAVQKAKSTP
jgi:mono/diheme cytochrome c family protein